MKQKYEELELEIVKFETQDVITASSLGGEDIEDGGELSQQNDKIGVIRMDDALLNEGGGMTIGTATTEGGPRTRKLDTYDPPQSVFFSTESQRTHGIQRFDFPVCKTGL